MLTVTRPDGSEVEYPDFGSKAEAADRIPDFFMRARIGIPYREVMRVRGEVVASPTGQTRRHHATGYSFTIKD